MIVSMFSSVREGPNENTALLLVYVLVETETTSFGDTPVGRTDPRAHLREALAGVQSSSDGR
eukprot:7337124-Heterocapsa_arctica.AAC.1